VRTQAERKRDAEAIRDKWRAEQPNECMWCGWTQASREWPNAISAKSHEIVCGTATRQMCLAEPAALLVLCDRCHEAMHACSKASAVVMGLVVKKRADPKHYDLRKVVKIWKPDCTEEFIRDIKKQVEKCRE
jgi:hypothetical protein